MTNETQALLVRIEASVAKFEKQMAVVARSAANSAKKAEDSFYQAGSGMAKGFERGAAGATRSMGQVRAQTANLSFQLNDIATQLASGTSPFTVMVQQGGQVSQIFQGSGGLVNSFKLLGAGIASMVNPTSLATLGIIALTGYLVQYFTTGEDAVPKLDDLLKEHAENIRALESSYDNAGDGLKRYAEESLAVQKAKVALSNVKLSEALDQEIKALAETSPLFERTMVDTAALRRELDQLLVGGGSTDRAQELISILDQVHEGVGGVSGVVVKASKEFEPFNAQIIEFKRGLDSGEPNLKKFREGVANLIADKNTPNDIKKLGERLLELTDAADKSARATLTAGYGITGLGKATVEAISQMNTALNDLASIAAPALTDAEKALVAYNVAMANAQGLEDRIAATKALEAALGRVATEQAKVVASGDAAALIKAKEGFRPKAYYDVNAYRAGYGSDTVTRADGSITKVTSQTIVTLAEAEADLARRIKEFQDSIKGDIGADLFNSMSEAQKAALTSIAYNYGSLPDRIIKAIQTGDTGKVYAAIRGLGGDNGGVNRARRLQEAELFAKGSMQGDAAIASFKAADTANSNFAERIAARKAEIAALKEEIGLKSQLGALEGANTAQLTAAQAARELLNAAVKDGLAAGKELASVQQLLYGDLSQLSPAAREQALAMREVALSYGEAKAASEGLEQSQKTLAASMQAASAFSKDVLGGFIRDLVAGKSASEALANALSKVADKLLDIALNSLFDTSGGGGLFGGLLGGIGKLFGFADGGIAARGKPVKTFARGGVSRSAAIFGEAGPEAAVPLPDGRRIPVALDMKNMKRGGGGGDGRLMVETVMRVEGGNLVPAMVQISGVVAGQKIQQSSKALPSRLGQAQRRGV